MKTKFKPPNWLPELEWSEFKKMRRRIKHPLTDFGCELIVQDLEKFKMQGYDVAAILRESIKQSWRGVFTTNQPEPRAARPKAQTTLAETMDLLVEHICKGIAERTPDTIRLAEKTLKLRGDLYSEAERLALAGFIGEPVKVAVAACNGKQLAF